MLHLGRAFDVSFIGRKTGTDGEKWAKDVQEGLDFLSRRLPGVES